MKKKLYGTTFCGNEASEYAKEMGCLDYATLSKAFDGVLANDLISKTYDIGFWEQIHGEKDYNDEIFQYYIISDGAAQLLQEWTDELIFYNEELDLYVWGVTHYGTSWSYVLTDIELNCGDEAFEDNENE